MSVHVFLFLSNKCKQIYSVKLRKWRQQVRSSPFSNTQLSKFLLVKFQNRLVNPQDTGKVNSNDCKNHSLSLKYFFLPPSPPPPNFSCLIAVNVRSGGPAILYADRALGTRLTFFVPCTCLAYQYTASSRFCVRFFYRNKMLLFLGGIKVIPYV